MRKFFKVMFINISNIFAFFEERYTVSNLKDLTKKIINVNHENLNEEDPFFDGVRN